MIGIRIEGIYPTLPEYLSTGLSTYPLQRVNKYILLLLHVNSRASAQYKFSSL